MKISLKFLLLGFVFLILCIMINGVRAQDLGGERGLDFINEDSLNNLTVQVIRYFGECPGRRTSMEETKAWFKDSEVEVKENRRVRIVNDSFRGDTNEIPYTDREYNRETGTEKIKFAFGDKHRGSRFVVKEGTNRFSYIIYDGEFDKDNMHVVKEGEFTAQIDTKEREVERNIEWSPPIPFCQDTEDLATGYSMDEYGGCDNTPNQSIPIFKKIGTCYGNTIYEGIIDLCIHQDKVEPFERLPF